MISISLKGRLGNQLFIYSFARRILERYPNEKIYLIKCYEYEKYKITDKSFLENYNINPNILIVDNVKLSFRQKIGTFIYTKFVENKDYNKQYNREKKFNKFFSWFFRCTIIQNGYSEIKLRKNMYYNGYFQSEKFFPNDVDGLKNELQPIHPVQSENLLLKEKIENDKNSICVDIRLGDYLNHPLHGICNVDYYLRAMKMFAEKVENPTFYVFSNEIEKLKDIFPSEYNIVYESGIQLDYEKLRIMSKCKHFIISNSSYSWWAQYLHENNDKIVVAPSRWYNKSVPNDIYQDNWILLEV